MKKLFYIILLPLLALLWACNDDSIDDLSGTFGDVVRVDLTASNSNPTTKLKKGLKMLDIDFTNEIGDTFNLKVVSQEWTLGGGTVRIAAEPAKVTEAAASVNGVAMASGDVDITLVNGSYIIQSLLRDANGVEYVAKYRGGIEFVIGEDDPEASGYIISVNEAPVTVMDWTSFQQTVIPGIKQFTLTVTDPNGADAGVYAVIAKDGLKATELDGTYVVTENANAAGQLCNGFYIPDYGAMGGSYAVGEGGAKLYLSAGSITITTVEGMIGEKLVNIKGTGLAWVGPTGNGTTNVSIPFATVLEKSGTELLDQTFTSQVLGRDVKYSVVLPKSFDGTKTFPVLYMLHGANGGNNDWISGGGNIDCYTGSAENEMIIVAPQCTFEGVDAFYINNYQGKGLSYEDFFITEFMPAIEAMYKGNGKRGIAGLSMGGFGSLYYGLKYTDKFVGMYACSPAIGMDLGVEGTNLYDMIWTPGAPTFTIEIGTEDFLYQNNTGFRDAMAFSPLNADFTFIERPGAHDWTFWAACSPKIIKFFDEKFSK